MRPMPMAARRSANGSFVPLGFWPMAKMPVSVSKRSASATASPVFDAGSRIAGAARLVVLGDGVATSAGSPSAAA